MSEKLVFGDDVSLVRLRSRDKLAQHLMATSAFADVARRRAAIEADEAAIARMVDAAQDVPPVVVVGRKKRAKRARVNTIAPSDDGMSFRPVYHGIDTYLANVVKSEVRADFMALLEYVQLDAKEAQARVPGPLPPFLGAELGMKPYGGGTFAYLLDNADVAVKVRRADHAKSIAAAQVQLSAACLHRLGYVEALGALSAWVELWAPGAVLQPSRVDLCVDSQGWQPTFDDFRLRAFVSPCSRPTIQLDGELINYVRYGTGGREGSRSGSAPIQFVMYDKSEEIRVHDKGWFIPLWAQNAGYVEDEAVFRCEARFTREYLKERLIETQADLVASLGALWLEALEWCRYCVVSENPDENDSNRSRLAVRSEWQVLAGVDWSACKSGPLQRIDQARPKLERTLAALGGHLVTLQALLASAMDADIRALAEMAVPALLHRWESRGESFAGKVESRVLRLGGLALA